MEVTESSLTHNLVHSRKQLEALRAIGVRIALDDFGVGECSLTLLRNFELDTLKIDRHLVARLPDTSRDAAVVRSVIDLCRQLDMLVIAEGVETLEQYQWLAANGCQLVQGFLVAHPLTSGDAQQFVLPFDWEGLKAI